jgi:hypothetical protein
LNSNNLHATEGGGFSNKGPQKQESAVREHPKECLDNTRTVSKLEQLPSQSYQGGIQREIAWESGTENICRRKTGDQQPKGSCEGKLLKTKIIYSLEATSAGPKSDMGVSGRDNLRSLVISSSKDMAFLAMLSWSYIEDQACL